MLSWIALACLAGAVALLAALSVIDLKTRLLPNELVAGFATLGVVFHLTTMAKFLSPQDMILGGVIGFTSLYLLRAAANKIYGQDALGLGDVKLIGAGGLWLGADMIMLAMSAGALLGLAHGLAVAVHSTVKSGKKASFAQLQIPAGPGFALGIIIIGVMKFWTFHPEGL